MCRIRAGSVVGPLHHPLRIAEEWSVVDNISGGRVGISFASGWHATDFALRPENYADRRQYTLDYIDQVRKLWRGEAIQTVDGVGKPQRAGHLPAAGTAGAAGVADQRRGSGDLPQCRARRVSGC